MLAVFSTNFQKNPSVAWNSQLRWYTYTYGTPTNSAQSAFYDPTSPGSWTSATCNNINDATLLSTFLYYSQTPASTGTTFLPSTGIRDSIIADSCENSLKTALNNYNTVYTSTTYAQSADSWRACDYLVYEYYRASCEVSRLCFSDCCTDSRAFYNGYGTSCFGWGYGCDAGGNRIDLPASCYSWSCTNAGCNCHLPGCNWGGFGGGCCQDCSPFLTTYNSYKWWYQSSSVSAACSDWQFKNQAYNTPADSLGT